MFTNTDNNNAEAHHTEDHSLHLRMVGTPPRNRRKRETLRSSFAVWSKGIPAEKQAFRELVAWAATRASVNQVAAMSLARSRTNSSSSEQQPKSGDSSKTEDVDTFASANLDSFRQPQSNAEKDLSLSTLSGEGVKETVQPATTAPHDRRGGASGSTERPATSSPTGGSAKTAVNYQRGGTDLMDSFNGEVGPSGLLVPELLSESLLATQLANLQLSGSEAANGDKERSSSAKDVGVSAEDGQHTKPSEEPQSEKPNGEDARQAEPKEDEEENDSFVEANEGDVLHFHEPKELNLADVRREEFDHYCCEMKNNMLVLSWTEQGKNLELSMAELVLTKVKPLNLARRFECMWTLDQLYLELLVSIENRSVNTIKRKLNKYLAVFAHQVFARCLLMAEHSAVLTSLREPLSTTRLDHVRRVLLYSYDFLLRWFHIAIRVPELNATVFEPTLRMCMFALHMYYKYEQGYLYTIGKVAPRPDLHNPVPLETKFDRVIWDNWIKILSYVADASFSAHVSEFRNFQCRIVAEDQEEQSEVVHYANLILRQWSEDRFSEFRELLDFQKIDNHIPVNTLYQWTEQTVRLCDIGVQRSNNDHHIFVEESVRKICDHISFEVERQKPKDGTMPYARRSSVKFDDERPEDELRSYRNRKSRSKGFNWRQSGQPSQIQREQDAAEVIDLIQNWTTIEQTGTRPKSVKSAPSSLGGKPFVNSTMRTSTAYGQSGRPAPVRNPSGGGSSGASSSHSNRGAPSGNSGGSQPPSRGAGASGGGGGGGGGDDDPDDNDPPRGRGGDNGPRLPRNQGNRNQGNDLSELLANSMLQQTQILDRLGQRIEQMERTYETSFQNTRRIDESDHQDGTSDAWYLRLPHPWNVTPKKTGKRSDEQKMATVDPQCVFDGEQRNFLPWRTWAIQNIHQANLPVEDKFKFLKRSVKSSDGLLASLFDSVRGNMTAYENAIRRMEEQWGGPHNITQHVLSELYADGQLDPNNSRMVSRLMGRLGTVFEYESDGLLEDIRSSTLIKPVMGRLLAPEDKIRFVRWARQHRPPRAAGVMHDLADLRAWIETLHKDLLAVDMLDGGYWETTRGSSSTGKPFKRSSYKVQESQDLSENAGSDTSVRADSFYSRAENGPLTREDIHAEIMAAFNVKTDETSNQHVEVEHVTPSSEDDDVYEMRNSDDEIADMSVESLQAYYATAKARQPVCEYCTKRTGKPTRHFVKECRALTALSAARRIEEITALRLCLLCFGKGHKTADCKKSFRCKCGGKHNKFLHIDFPNKTKQ